MRMVPNLDMDTEPFGAVSRVDNSTLMPMGDSGVGMQLKLTLTQWSNGTHPLKALSFHPGEFDEDVMVMGKLWPDVLIPLFGISDADFWAACCARWIQNMPLLFTGTVDKMSLKMSLNDEGTMPGDDEPDCGIQLQIGSVHGDSEGFIRLCLPPVTPEFVLSLCSGKHPLKPNQYIAKHDPSIKTPLFGSLKATYCLSTLEEAEQIEQAVRAEMVRVLPPPAPDAAPSLLCERFAYRVMPSFEIAPTEIEDFSKMTPEQGDKWVRSRMNKNLNDVQLLIYGVKGPAARTTPAHAADIKALAEKLGFLPSSAAPVPVPAPAAAPAAATAAPAVATTDSAVDEDKTLSEPPAKKRADEKPAASTAATASTTAAAAPAAKPSRASRVAGMKHK
jgi:hypothetical protein